LWTPPNMNIKLISHILYVNGVCRFLENSVLQSTIPRFPMLHSHKPGETLTWRSCYRIWFRTWGLSRPCDLVWPKKHLRQQHKNQVPKIVYKHFNGIKKCVLDSNHEEPRHIFNFSTEFSCVWRFYSRYYCKATSTIQRNFLRFSNWKWNPRLVSIFNW
jgi:hypothetical protein